MASADRVLQLYDSWHRTQSVDIDLNSPWHRLAKTYLDPAHDIAGRSILEIGCGRGEFACWLASFSPGPYRLVAADFSHAAVERGKVVAQGLGIENIQWERADIQSIPFETGCFDTVISCETIEHVPNPRRAVQELARVLKPGGKLVLTTPNYFGSFGVYRAYLRCVGRPYTEAGQPINNVVLLPLTRRWVTRAGLKVLAVDSVGIQLFIPRRHPATLRLPRQMHWLARWFGLQSCIIAQKSTAAMSSLHRGTFDRDPNQG